jgi:ribosomal protein S18 acetylase RimI-like enzyme
MQTNAVQVRPAVMADLENLLAIENACFSGDRLSKRSFRHYIQSDHGELLVAEEAADSQQSLSEPTPSAPSSTEPSHSKPSLLGYGLTWCHRGTRLARLYSLAVLPEARGRGIAQQLLHTMETLAAERGYLSMRLEVAINNKAAISLYEAQGYHVFGEYSDYYEDHSDALRMQKIIRHIKPEAGGISRPTPWYQQTTEFTCGPACLMMAMASFGNTINCHQLLELDIWREATTVFMTSGHGGCHPFGLALAAKRRGFEVLVTLNTNQTLFVEGVRSENKKQIIEIVHQQFLHECTTQGIAVQYEDLTQYQVESWLKEGYAVLVLISTYRMDGEKTPHWVVVTGIDDTCLYVNDSHVNSSKSKKIDCQHVPIARDDFARMSQFGANRLRTAVAIRPLDL